MYIIVRIFRTVKCKVRKNRTLYELNKNEVLYLEMLDRIILLMNGREQKKLTDFLGLKKTAFSDWKSGKSNSYKKYIVEISEFFGVSLDYLVYGKKQEFSEDVKELLLLYSQMDENEKKIIMERARTIIELKEKNEENIAKENVS